MKADITPDTATPFNPYILPNIIIDGIWIPKNILEPIITILLFVEPKYFEIYVETIADGIIPILMIWITTIDSKNFGNNIGTNIGDNVIVIIVITIEITIRILLTNLVEFPLESCVKIYVK